MTDSLARLIRTYQGQTTQPGFGHSTPRTGSMPPAVAILDENKIRAELFASWLDHVQTTVTTSSDGLLSAVQRSHLVVCLSTECDSMNEVVKSVRKRIPHVQILAIVSRDTPFVTLDRACDETLLEPVNKKSFRRALRRLLRRGLYSHKLHLYYQLSAALMAEQESADIVSATESDDWVSERIHRLKREIQSLAAQMDETDFDALLRAVRIRNRYFTEPERDETSRHASKYHPDNCPDCGLPWETSHGNDLGLGYKRIGAFVWECSRCGHIIKLSAGEYDKIL